MAALVDAASGVGVFAGVDDSDVQVVVLVGKVV